MTEITSAPSATGIFPAGWLQVCLPFGQIRLYAARLPLVQQLGLGAEIGLDAVVLDRTPWRTFAAWSRRLAHLPLTVHAPFMDLSPGGADPRIVDITRRRLLKAARLARLLGARAMVAHAGYDPNRFFEAGDVWLGTALETWRLVVAEANPDGAPPLDVLLENVYEADPGMLRRMFEAWAHPRLGFCFDAGHRLVWGRGASQEEWIDALHPWLRRLHMHDNDGTADQHLPIGRGKVDFAGLFAQLKRLGLRPEVTLEPHREEDVAPTLAGLLEHARSIRLYED